MCSALVYTPLIKAVAPSPIKAVADTPVPNVAVTDVPIPQRLNIVM